MAGGEVDVGKKIGRGIPTSVAKKAFDDRTRGVRMGGV